MLAWIVLAVAAAGLAVVGALVWLVAREEAARVRRYVEGSTRVFERGDAEGALALLEPLRTHPRFRAIVEGARMYALRLALRVDDAAELALSFHAEAATGRVTWNHLNSCVDTLVCAGRYQAAIDLFEAVPELARRHAHEARDPHYALVQINLAEADVNLGRAEAALARMEGWDGAVAGVPLMASGLGLQRGWILGALGRGEEALAAVEAMQREALGELFASEYHLSRTFAFLAVGRLDDAQVELAEALARARRPSTTRNALFLQARLAERRGDRAAALRLCREAAEHPHRWQGGDGLLFWGELLAEEGDVEGARRAWTLALERDAESASADTARARLAATGGAPASSAPASSASAELAPAPAPPRLDLSTRERFVAARPLVLGVSAALLVALSSSLLWLMASASAPREWTFPKVDPEVRDGRARIVGGTFLMGGTTSADERPQHLVTVREFWLDRYEVTVADYQDCLDAGACTKAACGPGCNAGDPERGRDPVNCVDWAQSAAYCAWAGGRLPTEEEWEFAARGGGEARLYPWGDAEPSAQLCWRRYERAGTCGVGGFEAGASRDGVLDLAGNVREWTSTPFRWGYDGEPSPHLRAVRGSDWDDGDPVLVRGAQRRSEGESFQGPRLGFRCAAEPAEPAEPADTPGARVTPPARAAASR